MARMVLEYGARPRLLGRRRVRVVGLVLVMMMGVGAAVVVGQGVWRAQEARKAAAERAKMERMKQAKLALFEAAEAGDVAGVRRALAEGVGVDVVDDRPGGLRLANRALEIAVLRGHHECAAMLLEAGANPNRGVPAFPLLQRAVRSGDTRMVELLLAKGADPNDRRSGYRSALSIAVERDDAGLVGMLLDAGAAPEVESGTGLPTMHIAAIMGRSNAMRVLLERGADPNVCDEHGRTALDLPWCEGEVKEMLIRAGGRHGDGYDWPRD